MPKRGSRKICGSTMIDPIIQKPLFCIKYMFNDDLGDQTRTISWKYAGLWKQAGSA